MSNVTVIAEAGVNHNGDLERALAMVEAAATAGADYVKFQTFRASEIATAAAPKAQYQIANDGGDDSQLAMLQRLELSPEHHLTLADHCARHGIRFLSTPFDLPSLDFLDRVICVPVLKLPSGEITNARLLLAAAKTGRPIILSTGMSTLSEVREALGVLAFGYVGETSAPGRVAFARAFESEPGQAELRRNVTLLHCTTEYPAPMAETNLRAMDTLRQEFALPVGFSDHTAGISAAIAATALGATVIEKHFTLDRTLPGPDHRASLEPDELAALVRGVRDAELALGTGVKAPTASEMKNRAVARKYIVASRSIRAGERFSEGNLAVKRAGEGRSPLDWWDLMEQTAERDYVVGEVISS